MKLQTIVYTDRMEASAAWWTTVLGVPPTMQSEMWTSFEVGDATLALHGSVEVPAESGVAVSLTTTVTIEDVVAELAAHGIDPEGAVIEQPFGRQVVFRAPEGHAVVVNEHR